MRHVLWFLCGTLLTVGAKPLWAQGDVGSDTAVLVRYATTSAQRTAFVRSQTILGLSVYAPAFATMVGDRAATRLASYMVVAGGTFFAANEVTRQLEVTPARQLLASRMAVRAVATGLTLSAQANLPADESAAVLLLSGVGGTAAGLGLGGGLTEGEAMAMVVGHDIAAASALSMLYIAYPVEGDAQRISLSTRVLVPMLAGWGGYAAGRLYAGNASYEVTTGDAELLWLGATIGATGAMSFVANGEPSVQAVASAVLIGGLAGVWGADRWLVRRFDHSRADGAFVALGGGAGALTGIGLGVLASGEAERGAAPTFAFAAIGAAAGVWLSERYAQPPRDEGRRYGVGEAGAARDRVRFTPVGALAAARGVPGIHPVLRITF